MTRAFSKAERIVQVERLLLTSRAHLSQAEIARRCDVHRATIARMIPEMIANEIPIRVDDQGLIYIDRTAYTSTIKFKLHEAVSVFLSTRLLARYSDKPNAHTIDALEKVGASLAGVMPALGDHVVNTSAALRTNLPKQPTDHQRILEKLVHAWANGTKVQLWYRPLRGSQTFQHTFAPYFLEPSAIGYSTYVIGLSEPPGKLRTRKLERIKRVVSTDEPFDVPADFDPNALLAGAWGIWFDEEDQPITVTLRFSGKDAIRRMGETCWHPSEQKALDPEGRLVWTGVVAAVDEMLPWIRGWGADCEVLEPPDLRERVMGEVRRQMRVYGIDAKPQDSGRPDLDLLGSIFGG